MKKLLIAVMSIALGLFATSCVPKTELSVSQSALTFDNKGASQTVSFTANKVWSATSNQSWCKVTPSSGDGSANSSQSFSVSCDPNTTYDPRNCNITVVCEELTALISVTQAEGSGLIISQTDYSLTNEAQTVSIEVKSNVDYLVSVEGDATSWIKVQSTKGLSSHTIVLAVSENKDYDTRTGKVTVKDVSGSLSQTVTIKQGEAYGLFITKPEYNLSNESHTLTVEVKANVTFDVVPQVDWIKYVETKGLKTSQIVLDIAANDTYDSREGKVVVRQTGGALSETLTIRQDEAFGLIITKTGYGLSSEEQTIDVEVKTNVELEVVVPDDCKDWIVPMGTKGLTTSHYTFLVKENGKTISRSGSITFKQKDGSLSDTVYIKQEGAEPFLTVSPSELKVSNEAKTYEVTVKANLDYEIDLSAQDWIKAEKSTADESTVLVKIAENAGSLREGIVVFHASDIRAALKVTQTGGVIVFADPKVKEICVQKWDTDGDKEISYDEAAAVVTLSKAFSGNKEITSFAELRYFTGLKYIFESAFSECDNLAVVEVPEGVETLQYGSFYKCPKLVSVTLPSTLQTMGSWVFYQCSSLKSIDLPESLTIIPEGCFSGCESLKSITIPKAVRTIGQSAFKGCNALTSVEIPDGVKIIKDRAFTECAQLESVVIAGSVDTIGNMSFQRCENLTDVSIAEGVKVVNHMAFDRCSNLSSIKLPQSVEYLGSYAFQLCTSLKSANIPEKITVGEEGVFSSCSNLTNVSLGGSIKEIGAFMFNKCTSLPAIDLPKSVTTLGKCAFQHCVSLISIIVPEGVTELAETVFNHCDNLTKVVLPDGLKVFGNHAFANCANLPGLEFPKNLTTIGQGCFSFCTSLTSAVIPESVEVIGQQAFSGCAALQSVVLPSTLSAIEAKTFNGCASLAAIKIPGSVREIGDSAFAKCASLTSVVLPEKMLDLGVKAFESCTGLTEIIIPGTVVVIKDYTFSRCENLKNVKIGEGVTTISERAFQYCSSMASISIPKSLRTIGEASFLLCKALPSVTLPEKMTGIGYAAFSGCTGLTTVKVLAVTPPAGSDGMFASTTCQIAVPAASVDVYKKAPYWETYASRIVALP